VVPGQSAAKDDGHQRYAEPGGTLNLAGFAPAAADAASKERQYACQHQHLSGTEAHPSGWQQLSPALSDPFCDPSWGIVLSNNGDYGLEVECWDFNGKAWFDDRGNGASGGWSGWY
jgi:hypothetical protein